MISRILLFSLCFVMTLNFGSLTTINSAKADPATEAEEIVAKSGFSLTKLWNHEQISPHFKRYLSQAVAIVIVPQSISGGFIIGGEGGTGILLAKGMNGWSYPVFLTVSSASIGLQIGAQTSESVYLIMTRAGLDAILRDYVKIGGNLKGAAGPIGASMDAASTTALNLDVISWSISKGAFIGASVAGTAFVPREALNRVYYDQLLKPEDIVLYGRASNPAADHLRLQLQEYTSQGS